MNLSKNPLLYINALLALVVALFVLNANADRWHLPAPVKQALAATVGVITDGGTSGRLTVFAAGTNNKIGDSIIQDNGSSIGVNMAPPAGTGKMGASDYYASDIGRWTSQLISGTCEVYIKPDASAQTLTATFCWGTAARGSGGNTVSCSGGTIPGTIMNADDIVGENETTPEGYNLGANCGPFPVSGTNLKLCHVGLVACIKP